MLHSQNGLYGNAKERWRNAKDAVAKIDESPSFERFITGLKVTFPWRFDLPLPTLERDYLRIRLNHHLDNFIPLVQPFIVELAHIHRVLYFGCGSGGSAIALAMTYPELRCYGTDIDEAEIAVATERAKLYGVADRCEFFHVTPSQPLPFAHVYFDFSQCSSVLEYAVEDGVRRFCVREMVRLVSPRGLLFFSVPNQLYPFEIHTRKWGRGSFSRLLGAHTIDSSFWEVRRLARPATLRLYRSPVLQLFRPWSNFCVRKEND